MPHTDAMRATDPSMLRRAMEAAGCHPTAIRDFLGQVGQIEEGAGLLLAEDQIAPVIDLTDAEQLPYPGPSASLGLDRLALIKLNGGLGTSMGLDGPKSLLPVHDGLSFLDITLRQVASARQQHGAPLPLLLMNSFNTQAASADYLAGNPAFGNPAGLPLCFEQGRVPKLLAESLQPASWPSAPDKAWCPPGHGEIYAVLARSGLLDHLLRAGFDLVFISNADNLGATLDLGILAAMRQGGHSMLMEVTDRTAADRKGGHLARRLEDGRLILREIAQCPDSDLAAFQDIARHRYFNTNNLWLHLPSLADQVAGGGETRPGLPLICNRKHLIPEDSTTPEVLQLETAMGAAIASFDGAAALRVSRRRFRPVKRCSDLLGLWSDAYALGEDGSLELVDAREGRAPVVDLDPRHYGTLKQLWASFPEGAPSLKECDHLEVRGRTRFGRAVRAVGRVEVLGPEDRILDIPDGQTLQGRWP